MFISELNVYDFLKDKINLSDTDARKYARELLLTEERLRKQINIDVKQEISSHNFPTKIDIKELEIKIEKGFKEVILSVVGAVIAMAGLSTAIIKLF